MVYNFYPGVAAGHIIGDLGGLIRAAVVNDNDDNVSVLYGQADGSFGERVDVVPVGLGPYDITSGNFNNDPVRRGKWIYERLLAGTIPDIPITVDAKIAEDPHSPLRKRFAKTREAYCWKCHQKMNPYGMALEMYDDFGRYRALELLGDKTKVPVDARGAIVLSGESGLDGQVKDAIEMMHNLAESPRVRQSFVRHAFRYWMDRNEMLDDSPTLIAADKAFVESGGSMKALITSLLTSDSFLMRK